MQSDSRKTACTAHTRVQSGMHTAHMPVQELRARAVVRACDADPAVLSITDYWESAVRTFRSGEEQRQHGLSFLRAILDAGESSDRFKASQSLSDKSEKALKMSSHLIWLVSFLIRPFNFYFSLKNNNLILKNQLFSMKLWHQRWGIIKLKPNYFYLNSYLMVTILSYVTRKLWFENF